MPCVAPEPLSLGVQPRDAGLVPAKRCDKGDPDLRNPVVADPVYVPVPPKKRPVTALRTAQRPSHLGTGPRPALFTTPLGMVAGSFTSRGPALPLSREDLKCPQPLVRARRRRVGIAWRPPLPPEILAWEWRGPGPLTSHTEVGGANPYCLQLQCSDGLKVLFEAAPETLDRSEPAKPWMRQLHV